MFSRILARRVVCLAVWLAIILLTWQSVPPLTAAPNAQATAFTFTAVGDLGGSTNTDGVLTGISNAGANFQLTLGDLSYGAYAPETAWCSYVQSKVGATFPFELGAGNHDMDAQPTGHINNFAACLPDRIGNLTGAYGKQYYFDYQNLARIIFISPDLTLDGETYAYTVGSARYDWLVGAIDGARSATLPWVIVTMHKNCISTGVKSCEIGTDLFNLLVAKKVDLVLQGHEHNYQRSKQLALNATCAAIAPNQYDAPCVTDDGTDNTYAKGAGMVLVIVGTGGKDLYASDPLDSEANYFARIAVPGVDVARHGFLQVSVSASALSGQFVGTSPGSTFSDAFRIHTTTLANFTARVVAANRVRLDWTTTSESTLVGFNVWRRRGVRGAFEKLNTARLPVRFAGQPFGAAYFWRDRRALPGNKYFYKLKLIHSDGTGEWSDVIKVKAP